MTTHPVFHNPEFDAYAADYDTALAQGLAVSGEDKMYFVRGRLAWLATCLRQLGEQPMTVLDYGCGIGSATLEFFEWLGVTSVVGTDISPHSLDVAQRTYGSERARFLLFDHYQPNASLDLVYCNGVFHHIPPQVSSCGSDLCGSCFTSWRSLGLLGKQPLESGDTVRHASHSLRPRRHTAHPTGSTPAPAGGRFRDSPNRFFVSFSSYAEVVARP